MASKPLTQAQIDAMVADADLHDGDRHHIDASILSAHVRALAAEVKRLREDNARLENLASALDALSMVLYPPPSGNILLNPWRERSAAVAEAKQFLKDGTSVIALIEAERDEARAECDRLRNVATYWQTAHDEAAEKRDAAKAEAARLREENNVAVKRLGLSVICGPMDIAAAAHDYKAERDQARAALARAVELLNEVHGYVDECMLHESPNISRDEFAQKRQRKLSEAADFVRRHEKEAKR